MITLINKEQSPPGGFHVRAATGAVFRGPTLSDVATRYYQHMKGNGMIVPHPEWVVETQTCQRLIRDGLKHLTRKIDDDKQR